MRTLRKAVRCSAFQIDMSSRSGSGKPDHWISGIHSLHSPSSVCARNDFVWWHQATPKLYDAGWFSGTQWVINVGTASGGCRRLLQAPPDRDVENIFDSQDWRTLFFFFVCEVKVEQLTVQSLTKRFLDHARREFIHQNGCQDLVQGRLIGNYFVTGDGSIPFGSFQTELGRHKQ